MKRLLFTTLICVAATGVFAQTITTDTIKSSTNTDTTKKDNIKVGFGDEGTGLEVEHHHHSGVSGFSIGLTLSRLDLGLTTLIDNGSFMSPPSHLSLGRCTGVANPFFGDLV